MGDGSLVLDEWSERKARLAVKKKMLIVLMYSGNGYFGLQRNPCVKTVSGDILEALHECSLINDVEMKNPKRIKFAMASKTDKNVSALGQIVSLMLPNGDVEQYSARLNAKLPKQIRILDVFRATKSFHAKVYAESRTYMYVCPSYAFHKWMAGDSVCEALRFRISAEVYSRINLLLQQFKGTHNFHNFTSGRTQTDASCMRHITNITCTPPHLYNDFECVCITISGQSFMLHQIRKMIGLIMAIVRGDVEDTYLSHCLSQERLSIPRAPGLGLFLDSINYASYNRRCSTGSNRSINWNSYKNSRDQFLNDIILSHIYETELNELCMWKWLQLTKLHEYGPLVDGPPKKLAEPEKDQSSVDLT